MISSIIFKEVQEFPVELCDLIQNYCVFDRMKLKVGDLVRAVDEQNKYYLAKIIKRDMNIVTIHYCGWSKLWNRDIDLVTNTSLILSKMSEYISEFTYDSKFNGIIRDIYDMPYVRLLGESAIFVTSYQYYIDILINEKKI